MFLRVSSGRIGYSIFSIFVLGCFIPIRSEAIPKSENLRASESVVEIKSEQCVAILSKVTSEAIGSSEMYEDDIPDLDEVEVGKATDLVSMLLAIDGSDPLKVSGALKQISEVEEQLKNVDISGAMNAQDASVGDVVAAINDPELRQAMLDHAEEAQRRAPPRFFLPRVFNWRILSWIQSIPKVPPTLNTYVARQSVGKVQIQHAMNVSQASLDSSKRIEKLLLYASEFRKGACQLNKRAAFLGLVIEKLSKALEITPGASPIVTIFLTRLQSIQNELYELAIIFSTSEGQVIQAAMISQGVTDQSRRQLNITGPAVTLAAITTITSRRETDRLTQLHHERLLASQMLMSASRTINGTAHILENLRDSNVIQSTTLQTIVDETQKTRELQKIRERDRVAKLKTIGINLRELSIRATRTSRLIGADHQVSAATHNLLPSNQLLLPPELPVGDQILIPVETAEEPAIVPVSAEPPGEATSESP